MNALKILSKITDSGNLLRLTTSNITYRNAIVRAFFNNTANLESDADKPKKKTERVPKITLISTDNTSVVTTLEDASKIAKRRDLLLIKTNEFDTKRETPVYKLVSNTDFIKTEVAEVDKTSKKSESKQEKFMGISAKIQENDLNTKIKQICKHLTKGYSVKLVVGLDNGSQESLVKRIKDNVKEIGNVVKEMNKKTTCVLVLSPKKEFTNETE